MTKISLGDLEQILAEECVKIDELWRFGSVSEDVYPLLYIAARDGEIGLVGALYAARKCGRLLAFLINNFLTHRNYPDAILAVYQIRLHPHRLASDHEAIFLLQSWLARKSKALGPG